jgi:tetratricopeptide (TPR) repeat protein
MDGEPRFTMLETMREYARERLEASGEMAAVQDQHARYFLEWVTIPAPAQGAPEQRAMLDRLQQELDNLRGVLHFLIEDGQAEEALRLSTAFTEFWLTRGNQSEGRGWLAAALALNGEVALAVRANALLAVADLAEYISTRTWVVSCREESLRHFARIGDQHGIARAYLSLGRSDEALLLFEALEDQQGIAMALDQRASLLRATDLTAARLGLEDVLGAFAHLRTRSTS